MDYTDEIEREGGFGATKTEYYRDCPDDGSGGQLHRIYFPNFAAYLAAVTAFLTEPRTARESPPARSLSETSETDARNISDI